MNDELFRQHFQGIQRQIAALKAEQVAGNWEEITAALEGLQLIYQEMQTSLAVADFVEEELLQQHQRISTLYQQYYDLFNSAPIGYLVTDANGLILEANQTIAQLLNVPHPYLAGKPLAVYVAQGDRSTFRTNLNRLSPTSDIQVWQINLSPRNSEPFAAELTVAIARNNSGLIESLRIGVYDVSRYQQTLTPQIEQIQPAATMPMSALPQSLDGLQVLIVDDEADAREFIAAVLSSHGIRVTAVATAAAALEALERFHPDVLVSDIRMPDDNGYSLIRKIRQLEAKKGWHIPTAALTAYLGEDRDKAIAAGFESHLHKLAQPRELVEMVARLAGRV
jgi:CheY-like chemotaxis protein